MILGLDAVSRLNMLRQLPLMHEALTSPLFSGIEVLGFNKIGENTFPNVMAMLTGLEEEELEGACPWPSSKHKLDPCPFIWKDFAKRGYRTLFNEDMGFTFKYCKTGFVEQPTDYYGIPFSSVCFIFSILFFIFFFFSFL